MKKKLSGRDVRIILIVLSIIIFGVNLWYLYKPYDNIAAQARAETEVLKAEIAGLTEELPKVPDYQQNVADYSDAMAEILSKYKSNVLQEDWVKYMMELRERYGYTVYTLEFGAPQMLYEFEAKTSPELQKTESYVLYSVTCSFELDNAVYEDVKTLLTDVYSGDSRTAVDKITVEKDESNGRLHISLTLKKFFVQTYNEYAPPDIPMNNVGVDDPFKTLGISADIQPPETLGGDDGIEPSESTEENQDE